MSPLLFLPDFPKLIFPSLISLISFVSTGISVIIQWTQILPATLFASGSSIITARDFASFGTFKNFKGIEILSPPLYLHPYFFGITSPSLNAEKNYGKGIFCN